jgi:hypothetical protein
VPSLRTRLTSVRLNLVFRTLFYESGRAGTRTH